MENCGPESNTSQTGSGDHQRMISTDGGGGWRRPHVDCGIYVKSTANWTTGHGFIIQPEMASLIREMWNPVDKFCRVSRSPTVYDVVRNCIHELVNVLCDDEEEEEQTMEEWVVIVRDTMHMIVAEPESQGLVGVALKG